MAQGSSRPLFSFQGPGAHSSRPSAQEPRRPLFTDQGPEPKGTETSASIVHGPGGTRGTCPRGPGAHCSLSKVQGRLGHGFRPRRPGSQAPMIHGPGAHDSWPRAQGPSAPGSPCSRSKDQGPLDQGPGAQVPTGHGPPMSLGPRAQGLGAHRLWPRSQEARGTLFTVYWIYF